METYKRTHPWLTFDLNMQAASASLWLLLGEARSKCGHLAGVPLMPETAELLHDVYLAKGVHATTAIEGNTLNEQEVLEIIQKQKNRPPSQDYLQKEVENVIEAANNILDDVEQYGERPISVSGIMEYNSSVLQGLELEDYAVPGQISKVPVGVLGYRGVLPSESLGLFDRLCDWLNSDTYRPPDEDAACVYGLIKSIMAHLYLVWIHPFGDGNGRAARLLEVRFLMEAGVPSAASHLLSNHYNRTRTEYYRQLAAASRNGGNPLPFIEYAVSGFVEQIREQLQFVKYQQWDVSWINYVHECYQGAHTVAAKRQRDLVLELSNHNTPVARREIRRLSPLLAEQYAGKTGKTLTRDLNAVVKTGLVKRNTHGYRALKESILHFLPRSKQGAVEAQIEEARELTEEGGQLRLDI